MPSSNEMPRAYNPNEVEESLYRSWMEKGYFTPEVDHSKKPFVVIMPLPNVTGDLHLGHALTMSLQDILTRWHRMLGRSGPVAARQRPCRYCHTGGCGAAIGQ